MSELIVQENIFMIFMMIFMAITYGIPFKGCLVKFSVFFCNCTKTNNLSKSEFPEWLFFKYDPVPF